MALLGGAGPAVVAGLCAFAALGYAVYQVRAGCAAKRCFWQRRSARQNPNLRLGQRSLLTVPGCRADNMPSETLQWAYIPGIPLANVC